MQHLRGTISKEAFDELVRAEASRSTRTARLAIALALLCFVYGVALLVVLFAHLR